MKIVVLTGSPHEGGTSAYLVENYVAGLKEKHHEVIVFDTAKLEIHPCIGCDYCRRNDSRCVFQDDMGSIYDAVKDADRIVFATPTYYFGMTAHIKGAIDRFYAINGMLRESKKEYDLLAVCGDHDEWTMDALVLHYQSMVKYLNGKPLEPLLAYGFYTRSEIEKSDYADRAKKKGMA